MCFAAVTASTGIAGVNIGGQTIHSWLVARYQRQDDQLTITLCHIRAGVGLGNEDAQTLATRMIRQDKEKRIGRADANVDTALERWTKTNVLIVDESKSFNMMRMGLANRRFPIVSMIDGRFLDKLEAIGRILRKNDLPFGGIQLVLCGE